MKIRHTWFVFLVLGAALFSGSTASASEDALPGEISADRLFDLVADELVRVVDSNKRFEPLPPVLDDIFISPAHPPCFALELRDFTILTGHRTRQALQDNHHAEFHLLVNRKVVGWGEKGRIVLTNQNGRDPSILYKESRGIVDLRRRAKIKSAYYSSSGWLFQTWTGFVKEDGEKAWPESEEFLYHCIVIKEGDTLVVIKPPYSETSRKRKSPLFKVCVGRAGHWDCRTFERLPHGFAKGVKGVLLRNHNEFLALGNKIFPLGSDLKPVPSEIELAAFLDAAEKGDQQKLTALLPKLTLYSTEILSGLITLLKQMPNAPREGPAKETDLSPRNLATNLESGMQYYKGDWLSLQRILIQPNLSEAYAWVAFRDPLEQDRQYGLFRIDRAGDMTPLFLPDIQTLDLNSLLSADASLGVEGRILFHFKGYGLAEVNGDRFTWIDRGERIRTMDRLIGCDSRGRIYFAQDRIRSSKILWIYHRDGTSSDPAVPSPVAARIVPGCRTSVLDDQGRVWYVSPPAQTLRRNYRNRVFPLPVTRPETLKSGVRQMTLGFCEVDALSEREKEKTELEPGLFYIDGSGRHHRCLSDIGLDNCALIAGRHGSLLVVSETRNYLIQGQNALEAYDLHQLAAEKFDLLVELAPRETPPIPPGGLSRFDPAASCLSVNGIVWIAHKGRVEAYRQSKSLSFQRRITLLAGKSAKPCLAGPFGPGKRNKVLIILDPNSYVRNLWAIQDDEGIRLKQSLELEIDDFSRPSGGPFAASTSPLFDFEGGRIICSFGYDRLMEVAAPEGYAMLPVRGNPVLVFPDGRLLVERKDLICPVYTILSEKTSQDILLTIRKPLIPAALCDDGSILCLSPQGVAWIGLDRKGDYELIRKLDTCIQGTPRSLVGQTEKMIHVLTDQNHLVSIPIE